VKAVVCHQKSLAVADLPDPEPGPGQVLLAVRRCGICGSDLHARHSSDELADVLVETGYDGFMRAGDSVVLGHEFCGEVVDHGPGSRRTIPTGQLAVALPLVRGTQGMHPIGLAANAPGAYAEQVVVEETLTLPVPNGLSAPMAAMTEPLAIAWHAVRRGEVKKKRVAVVIGCGPIGLAVILMLKAHGVRTVIASDFSAGRRALATRCGADVVVDPAAESPWSSMGSRGYLTSVTAAGDLLLDTMGKLDRLPVPWHHVFRVADRLGAATPKAPVVFECVGVPGVIDQIVSAAPLFSRVVVVGVCMGDDRIRPSMAINKEIELRFVLGYSPMEFRDTLHMLAEGKVDPSPLVTGTVGLPGVAGAFEALGDPEAHAKILIDPASNATLS
jgi:threonine dehydrogenase-like Zn-dependent dehydrogenase